ncbi:hypothetical protein AAGS61_11785 [Lysinibacillus sp. KU-BSD001]|uniref:hypothetical protein n=1 Tax=Lysinibacillus sp. KU-BSD001 TaxID=3141328 RepID=UPI0036E994E9
MSIALLTACSSSLASTSPNSETALIQVVNNSDNKIRFVELYFDQDLKQPTTQGAANADGSALKKGDILSFELSSSEFDLNQPVTIKAFVEIDNVKMSAGTVESIQLSKGNAFNFEITEDTSSNVIFQKLETVE